MCTTAMPCSMEAAYLAPSGLYSNPLHRTYVTIRSSERVRGVDVYLSDEHVRVADFEVGVVDAAVLRREHLDLLSRLLCEPSGGDHEPFKHAQAVGIDSQQFVRSETVEDPAGGHHRQTPCRRCLAVQGTVSFHYQPSGDKEARSTVRAACVSRQRLRSDVSWSQRPDRPGTSRRMRQRSFGSAPAKHTAAIGSRESEAGAR